MKIFYIIFLIFVFFTSNAFGYHCYFRPYSEGIRVANINGRQIYTIFGSHSSKEKKIDAMSELFLSDDGQVLGRTSSFNRFLSENWGTISAVRATYRRLTSLLGSEQIDWIGVEDHPDAINRGLDQLNASYTTFRSRLSSLYTETQTNDLLYLLYPSWAMAAFDFPNAFKTVKIVPLEDKELHDEAGQLLSQLLDLAQSLLDLDLDSLDSLDIMQQTVFMSLMSSMNSLIDHLLNQSEITNPTKDIEQILDIMDLNLDFDPIITSKFEEVVEGLNNWVRNMIARDNFAVQKVNQTEGNGIIIRGSLHRENIETGLELTQPCLDSGSL